jgi:hypothetical protein
MRMGDLRERLVTDILRGRLGRRRLECGLVLRLRFLSTQGDAQLVELRDTR